MGTNKKDGYHASIVALITGIFLVLVGLILWFISADWGLLRWSALVSIGLGVYAFYDTYRLEFKPNQVEPKD